MNNLNFNIVIELQKFVHSSNIQRLKKQFIEDYIEYEGEPIDVGIKTKTCGILNFMHIN